jgi:hypothetical protein
MKASAPNPMPGRRRVEQIFRVLDKTYRDTEAHP